MISTNVAGAPGLMAARLERLPLSRWHKSLVALLAAALVFEYMDLYSFAFTAPALMQHEGFTVENIASITAFTAFGTLIGALAAGKLADRFGRKPVLLACVATYSLGSLVNGLVVAPTAFLALRFVTAIGFQGMNVVAIVLLAELMPALFRGRAQAWAITVGGIGPVLMAWLGYFVVPSFDSGWRVLYLVGGLGIVLFFVLMRGLTESPRWLATVGKTERAESTMAAIEAKLVRAGHVLRPVGAVDLADAEAGTKISLLSMFRAGYGGRFAFTASVWTFGIVAFFGFNYWASTMLKLRGFSLEEVTFFTALIVTVGTFGPLVATSLTDRFQRKHLLVTIGSGIGLLALALTQVQSTVAVIALACAMSFMLNMSVAPTNTYISEVLPTHFRSTALGWVNTIARIANIVAAQAISALLLGFGTNAVFLLIAGLQFALALVAGIWGVRTRNATLEDISKKAGQSDDPAVTADERLTPVPAGRS